MPVTPGSRDSPDKIKPMSELPTLKLQLDRALILRASTSMGVLGSGAQTGPQMLVRLCSPDISMTDVAAMIRKEPAMCARVLRVANSSYYGASRGVQTIERALLLLGLDAVRTIAAATCLDRTISGNKGCRVDLAALLQHSLGTAIAAESLAKFHHPALASDAFIAGLLHNMGVLVQIQADFPGVAAMIARRQIDATSDMRLLESDCTSVGHEYCVAVLFEEWKLPGSLVAAVGHHHDPLIAPRADRELACLVNLGANLALAAGATFTLEPAPVERSQAAMSSVGLTDEDLDKIVAVLPDRLTELSTALLGR